jgi:tetratricopeptide (TPR) repeat protein
MRLPIFGFVVVAGLLSSTPAHALNPLWDQCKDVNNRKTADEALAACGRLLNDKSEAKNQAMILRNRCGIYYTKTDYDRALADCNQALSIDPESAIGYNRRGLISYQTKRYDSAIADFTQALRLDASFAYAYFNRALARRAKGDAGGADADQAEAIRLDPKLAK